MSYLTLKNGEKIYYEDTQNGDNARKVLKLTITGGHIHNDVTNEWYPENAG